MPNVKPPVIIVGFINIDIMNLVLNQFFTKRENNYRIWSRNLLPCVFCAPQFLKDDFGFIFAPRISRTIELFISLPALQMKY
jgi:hypothetical protein